MRVAGFGIFGPSPPTSDQLYYDSSPRLQKLACPLRPITGWSCMAMPSASAAALISRVISMPSRDGL